MRIQVANRLSEIYDKLVSSIGFLPTLITLGFATVAAALLGIDTSKPTAVLLEHLPGLVIKDGDTARVLLSTIVGGIISLTVFSFTMVMSQLNRAASSYSPRLLPGLVSTRSHQVVLGIYLGTITFTLFVLISIEPSDDEYTLPGLAVLVAIVLVLSCLGVFIYFIHSISQAIQVGNILKGIAKETRTRLETISESKARQQGQQSPLEQGAHELRSHRAGYFCECKITSLQQIAERKNLEIAISARQGEFLLTNAVVGHTNSEVDEETRDEILSCLPLDGDERVGKNYVYGFKQINEIAIRAMSPGINDPGTALVALDHLASLLRLRMQFDDREIYQTEEGVPSVEIAVVSFSELLYSLFAPLRCYCKNDVIVILKMIEILEYLYSQPTPYDTHKEAIKDELQRVKRDALDSISNPEDCARIEQSSLPDGKP